MECSGSVWWSVRLRIDLGLLICSSFIAVLLVVYVTDSFVAGLKCISDRYLFITLKSLPYHIF